MTPYLGFLLAYLTLADFFDSFATAFRFHMTTYVREEFGVPLPEMLRRLSWVYVGSCLGFLPRMAADLVGRRFALWAVLVGLCAVQWLIGAARSAGEYVALLTVLAVFYKSDIWMLVMSEEAPRERRAFFTTLPVVVGGLGAVMMGALVREMGPEPGAWRAVARFPIWGVLVSIPCALIMRETRVFQEARRDRGRPRMAELVVEPFRGRYARPLVVVTALKVIYLAGATTAIALIGTEFLRVANGFAPATVGRLIQLQTAAMVVGAMLTGYLSDRFGRLRMVRLVAVLYAAALAGMALAPAGSSWVAACYLAQAFFDAGVICILRIVTIESFASRFRATGAAFSDLIPTAAAIGTSWLLGLVTGAGVSLARVVLGVAVMVVGVLPIFALLNETRQIDLREV